MGRVRDLQPYVGRQLDAKIIEVDKNRNNVVLSRRQWLEQTQSGVRSEFLNQLGKGQVRKASCPRSSTSVRSSTSAAWTAWCTSPSCPGRAHRPPVRGCRGRPGGHRRGPRCRHGRERVSLSLKATQEDPWRHFARTHAIGQVVPGKVTKLVPFGAFVASTTASRGLVHISELAGRHVEIPEQVVTVDDEIFVRVIDIDLERPDFAVAQAGQRGHHHRDRVRRGARAVRRGRSLRRVRPCRRRASTSRVASGSAWVRHPARGVGEAVLRGEMPSTSPTSSRSPRRPSPTRRRRSRATPPPAPLRRPIRGPHRVAGQRRAAGRTPGASGRQLITWSTR